MVTFPVSHPPAITVLLHPRDRPKQPSFSGFFAALGCLFYLKFGLFWQQQGSAWHSPSPNFLRKETNRVNQGQLGRGGGLFVVHATGNRSSPELWPGLPELWPRVMAWSPPV